MTSDRCIICLGIGRWHPRGVARLNESLDAVGYTGGRLFWDDQWPEGVPEHSKTPYAFKPHCFHRAIAAGYRYILWVDSSFWAVAPVEPLFDRIKDEGAYIVYDGWSVGQWCHDAALKTLGLRRVDAFDITLIWAGMLGLDVQNETSRKFLDDWTALADDGVTFPGAWTNNNYECSEDSRVKGHRHDQTAASVLAWKYRLAGEAAGFSYCTMTWQDPRKGVIFVAAGMSS